MRSSFLSSVVKWRASAWALAATISLVFVLPACYVGGAKTVDPRRMDEASGWLRARNVSFVPQRAEDDCGAAALAIVLNALHAEGGREEIARAIPPRDGGIRAGDLRDFARRAGLRAFVLKGTREDLQTQLSRGRPVLVGLAKPLSDKRAILHYEVVAGMHRDTGAILTVDPAVGWRESSWVDFAREWQPTGGVTLLIFPTWDLSEDLARREVPADRPGVW